MPLDQGAFDAHQSKKTILAVLAGIGDALSPRIPEDSDFWEVVVSTIADHGAVVHSGKTVGVGERGAERLAVDRSS